MKRYRLIFVLLFTSAFYVTTYAQIKPDQSEENMKDDLNIILTSLDITDKTLKLSYEIRNDSRDDVWFLVEKDDTQYSFDMVVAVFIDEDAQTLMIRKRLNLPSYVIGRPIYGRYVRLKPGEKQVEAILRKLPVHTGSDLDNDKTQDQDIKYATHLSFELGYQKGNPLEKIFRKIEEVTEIPSNETVDLPKNRSLSGWSVISFNGLNELLTSRDDEIWIPRSLERDLNNERILEKVVDNVHIPYKHGKEDSEKLVTFDIEPCTKVEIRYQPSMLEYFFPYYFQQGLFSLDEIEYVKTNNTIVLTSDKEINLFVNNVSKAFDWGGGMVHYRSKADVICYHESGLRRNFSIYNNNTIVVEAEDLQFFDCPDGFPVLEILTPQIRGFMLRTQCATNLKNLWYRLSLYNKRQIDSSFENEEKYPTPTDWCDAMLRPHHPVKGLNVIMKFSETPHRCPSAGEGKNHYAINPNCEPNSPSDMVLLFETKAGWNQHGGPELFTFDNHDPKRPAPNVLPSLQRSNGGGCVLLNDGTVKFIRTEEELNNLRWKLTQ